MHVTTNYIFPPWLQWELCVPEFLPVFSAHRLEIVESTACPLKMLPKEERRFFSETLGFSDEKLRDLAVLLLHSVERSLK